LFKAQQEMKMHHQHHGIGHAEQARESGPLPHAQHDAGSHSGHGRVPSPKDVNQGGGHAHHMDDFRRRFWVCIVLTVPIVLLSHMVVELLHLPYAVDLPAAEWIVLVLSTVVFFYGGWPFLHGLWYELRERRPGMMTLIGLATTVAYVFSVAVTLGFRGMPLFWELATLIAIMLLGHWLEMRAVLGASHALEALVRLLPSDAHRLNHDGSTTEVPVTQLQPGDLILVKPGEKVPTDGGVEAGESSVNEAMLTGESAPVHKVPGAHVIGGSVNGEGALTVVVERVGSQTYLSQVIELVRQAQASKSQAQDLANRAAFGLTLVALGGGILTLVVWLLLGEEPASAIERMVTVMVIACPHALGLAVPLVIAVSTSLAAGHGLLIRDRMAFERAKDLDAMVFDKTGTLTEGRFGIVDVFPLGDLPAEEVLRLTAALESRSEHPIATGIVGGARQRGVAVPAPESFEAIPGKGARATVEGHEVLAVSPGHLSALGLQADSEAVSSAAAQGKTVVYAVVDGKLAGAIALADIIKEDSRGTLEQLKALGIKVMMLTGDAEPVARWVAGELKLDEFFAQVLPHEKSQRIAELKQRGMHVGMVGDGVNDAPALAEADLGIAIGAGSDVAIETADVILVRSNPVDVLRIIQLSRATYRKMVQNLWWAAGYNIVAMPLAAGVLSGYGLSLTPAAGAVLMSVSTIIVAINARRLKLA
jgi:P-type Cu2+ transporter